MSDKNQIRVEIAKILGYTWSSTHSSSQWGAWTVVYPNGEIHKTEGVEEHAIDLMPFWSHDPGVALSLIDDDHEWRISHYGVEWYVEIVKPGVFPEDDDVKSSSKGVELSMVMCSVWLDHNKSNPHQNPNRSESDDTNHATN